MPMAAEKLTVDLISETTNGIILIFLLVCENSRNWRGAHLLLQKHAALLCMHPHPLTTRVASSLNNLITAVENDLIARRGVLSAVDQRTLDSYSISYLHLVAWQSRAYARIDLAQSKRIEPPLFLLNAVRFLRTTFRQLLKRKRQKETGVELCDGVARYMVSNVLEDRVGVLPAAGAITANIEFLQQATGVISSSIFYKFATSDAKEVLQLASEILHGLRESYDNLPTTRPRAS